MVVFDNTVEHSTERSDTIIGDGVVASVGIENDEALVVGKLGFVERGSFLGGVGVFRKEGIGVSDVVTSVGVELEIGERGIFKRAPDGSDVELRKMFVDKSKIVGQFGGG